MSDIDSASGALETAATALKKLKALEDAADLKAAVDGLGNQIQGLLTLQHIGRKEATDAHVSELLEAVRALTKATKDAAAQAASGRAAARKLSLMQTHAALLATLSPEHNDQHPTNRALVLMAKLYGYTPKEMEGHCKVAMYYQAKEAKEALVYLTAGYKHGGVSYDNLECV